MTEQLKRKLTTEEQWRRSVGLALDRLRCCVSNVTGRTSCYDNDNMLKQLHTLCNEIGKMRRIGGENM